MNKEKRSNREQLLLIIAKIFKTDFVFKEKIELSQEVVEIDKLQQLNDYFNKNTFPVGIKIKANCHLGYDNVNYINSCIGKYTLYTDFYWYQLDGALNEGERFYTINVRQITDTVDLRDNSFEYRGPYSVAAVNMSDGSRKEVVETTPCTGMGTPESFCYSDGSSDLIMSVIKDTNENYLKNQKKPNKR